MKLKAPIMKITIENEINHETQNGNYSQHILLALDIHILL